MRRAFPIALKVNLIIVASLVIGIGGGIFYIAISHYRSSLAETDLDGIGDSQWQFIFLVFY